MRSDTSCADLRHANDTLLDTLLTATRVISELRHSGRDGSSHVIYTSKKRTAAWFICNCWWDCAFTLQHFISSCRRWNMHRTMARNLTVHDCWYGARTYRAQTRLVLNDPRSVWAMRTTHRDGTYKCTFVLLPCRALVISINTFVDVLLSNVDSCWI